MVSQAHTNTPTALIGSGGDKAVRVTHECGRTDGLLQHVARGTDQPRRNRLSQQRSGFQGPQVVSPQLDNRVLLSVASLALLEVEGKDVAAAAATATAAVGP